MGVVERPTIFEPLRLEVPVGVTLAELVRQTEIPEVLHDRVILILNGQIVRDWEHVFTKANDVLTIGVVPAGGDGGGKRVFAAIAVLAIAIAAPYIAGALLPGLTAAGTAAAAGAVTTGQVLAFNALTAGISMVGALAISALVPPPSIGSTPVGASQAARSSAESPTYGFGGQANRARVFATVKRVYGSYRVAADLGAVPLIDNVGKASTISGVYYFSVGDCTVDDIRFGDQSIDTYEPALRVLRDSYGDDLRYMHRGVGYDEFAFSLSDTAWLQLQTKSGASKATVDFTFPAGLVRMNKAERLSQEVPLQARWRLKNSGDPWTYLSSSRFSGASDSDDGGVTYTPEYDFDNGIDGDDCTAWVIQTKSDKDGGSKTRILLYRDGKKIYQTQDYDPGQESSRSVIRSGGVTYAPGAFTGDTSQSEDNKTEVYAELLVGEAITGNAVRIRNNTREPFTVGAQFSFPEPATYEIEVRRTQPPTASDAVSDAVTVTLLRSYFPGSALDLRHRATMVELQVIATEQLRGSLPAVNALVTSRLRRFNSSGFTGSTRESSNPAEIAIDMLTGGPDGAQTRFPLEAGQIEFSDFKRLRDICAEVRSQSVNGVTWTGPRFEWNGVIETDIPLGEAVNAVLSVARAQLRLTASGKIGCLIDEEQTTPRALITPANSWGFSGSRPFPRQPHAIRINFTDEDRDYLPTSATVYNTGFSEKTATIIEELDGWGITNFAEAWRYGRFMLAQAILRSEIFTVSQDAENLVVQRGELVKVQHDVPRHGGMAARVAEVQGVEVTLDRPFDGAPSGYLVRSSTGALSSGAVTAVTGPETFTAASGHVIARGDLITIGELDHVAQDYLVKSVEPGEDYSARLQLVKYDAAVYDDEAGELPPWDPGFGDDYLAGSGLAAVITTSEQTWEYVNRRPVKEVDLAWKITGANPSSYVDAVIEWRVGDTEWRAVGRVTDAARAYTHQIGWEERAYWSASVIYRVRPFTALGNEGAPGRVSMQLTDYTLKPEPPRNCFLDVRGQELTLSWDFSRSPDVSNYLIRFSPDTGPTVTWHSSIPLAAMSWDQDQASSKARTGTYLIRAVNYTNHASTIVHLRTTIEDLPDINVIEIIDESDPATPGGIWPGPVYRFTKNTGIEVTLAPILHLDGITVSPVFLSPISYDVGLLGGGTMNVDITGPWGADYLISEPTWDPDTSQDRAVYTVSETIDLGAVYEALLQAQHMAFAVIAADLPSVTRAVTFSTGLQLLDDDDPIEWNCWMEYRAASQSLPIKDWGPIDAHGPIASAAGFFGEWRKFNATKATARYIQFRIVAESEQDDVRIVVTGGRIEVDMVDRQSRVNNQTIQAGGTVINFDPAFAAKPVVAVTIEGATAAVRYEALSLDRNSVEIALYDAAGTSVPGQVDVAALGYGKERSVAI